jgi:hypothetical protein
LHIFRYGGTMATMARDAWTDERLDDLNAKVDRLDQRMEAGFADIRAEFRALRGEVRAEIGAQRGEMNSKFTEVNAQFAAQQRMLLQLFGGMFATMMVGFLGVIATVLTQT